MLANCCATISLSFLQKRNGKVISICLRARENSARHEALPGVPLTMHCRWRTGILLRKFR